MSLRLLFAYKLNLYPNYAQMFKNTAEWCFSALEPGKKGVEWYSMLSIYLERYLLCRMNKNNINTC